MNAHRRKRQYASPITAQVLYRHALIRRKTRQLLTREPNAQAATLLANARTAASSVSAGCACSKIKHFQKAEPIKNLFRLFLKGSLMDIFAASGASKCPCNGYVAPNRRKG